MIDTSLTSSNFYFLIAVIQGVVLSAIIIYQKPRKIPSLFIGILVLLFSSALLHVILEESIHAFNVLFPVPMEFSMAYGPLTYFHILYIKDPMRQFRKVDLLHFVPTLVFDIIVFSAGFLYLRQHTEWAQQNIPIIQTIALFVAFFGVIQLSIYTYFIIKESRDTKAVLREFVNVKRWLKYLIRSWTVIIGFLLIVIVVGLIFIQQLDDNLYLIYKPMGTIMALFIYIIGYLYVIKYSAVVRSYMEKVSKFNFSSNELEEKKSQLIHVLQEEKIYKDSTVTVAKLAGHLGWPINNLSKVINEVLHTNFNDLINQYRVSAFKEVASSPESNRYSIAGLGQEVGFSSKASFYRAFKKETGMTPSEFLDSK